LPAKQSPIFSFAAPKPIIHIGERFAARIYGAILDVLIYFFECMHWVASLSLAVGTGPWIIAMFLPPVLMAWLPMRVSGVPMVEAASAKKREDHAGYMRTTDTLIPWPPRHS
jgi:hypothetical protein